MREMAISDRDESRRRSPPWIAVLLLIVVPILGWVGYCLHWIYERHAQQGPIYPLHSVGIPAPAALRIFGEQGADLVIVVAPYDNTFDLFGRPMPNAVQASPSEESILWDRACSLFPEADIRIDRPDNFSFRPSLLPFPRSGYSN